MAQLFMKTYSITFALWLALSLTSVHAGGILSADSDPLALLNNPAVLSQPIYLALLSGNSAAVGNQETILQAPTSTVSLINQIGSTINIVPPNLSFLSPSQPLISTINTASGLPFLSDSHTIDSDSGSLFQNNSPIETTSFTPVISEPLNLASSDSDSFDAQPLHVVAPEPSEFSLLVVGLTAIALVFRFSPRKA
jgi:hypothetical protein